MMYRRIILASAGAMALSAAALAAEPLPPPPIFSWTGLFVGAQIGGAWDRDPVTVSAVTPPTASPPPTPPTASLAPTAPTASPPPPCLTCGTAGAGPDPPGFLVVSSLSDSPSGVIGGAHIGYNLQVNQWVAGLEGTVDGTSIHSSLLIPLAFLSPVGFATADTRSDIQGSIRLRAGIAFDRVLLYATGGAAFAGITTVYTTGVPFFITESDSKTRSGWTVGGGLEYALTNTCSIRAEYRYSDFGHSVDYPFASLSRRSAYFPFSII
jgi:outer membrane immunogenic protein